MNNSEDRNASETSWRLASMIISALAIVISLVSVLYIKTQHTDELTSELIRNTYYDFLNLSDLQVENWDLGHLFSLEDQYCLVKGIAKERLSDLPAVDHNKILLKERAIAEKIFTMYEHAYYQWTHAKEVGDIKRQQFLSEVLAYYTGRALRNPRLLWYWSAEGGNLKEHFEPEVIEFYDAHVSYDPSMGPDSTGLFAKDVESDICIHQIRESVGPSTYNTLQSPD